MKGTIAYRFETPAYPGNILYLNLISNYSCTNSCAFCGRPKSREKIGQPNIYEKKAGSSLYLEKNPTVKQALSAIAAKIKPTDNEIAIVGLGEPLLDFPAVEKLVKKIKLKYPVKTRIDTNGTIRCIFKNPAQRLAKAGLDEIRISLNAVSKKEYDKLCNPIFPQAFEEVQKFIKDCIKEGIETKASFVEDFKRKEIKQSGRKEREKFALSLGIKKKNIIFRKFMKPIKVWGF